MAAVQNAIDITKPVVICLAGNMCSPRAFDRIHFPQKVYLDYLWQDKVCDVDALGWWVIERIEKMGLKHPILAGYSAGGVTAISAASKRPELIDALILSNTGVSGSGNSKPGFAAELRKSCKDPVYLDKFVRSCFAFPLNDDMAKIMVDYALQCKEDAAVGTSTSIRQNDFGNAIRNYKNPVCILWGKLDTRRTKTALDGLVECLPQAEVHLLEAGHTPMWDAAAEYEKFACAFIEKLYKK